MQLEIDRVSKSFRERHALREVTLHIRPGVTGLLGPNGAGKSTLMRMLATITKPTAGTVKWNGTDIAARPNELRKVLGYLPQDFGVYPNLSATEFLRYLAAAKGLGVKSAKDRIEELLELVNLGGVGTRPLGTFSGGMRQRVGIAQALLNDPRLLIVDEPTVGLDPEERMRFRHLLGELAQDRIVLLSTHIVSDVEAVADEIALLAGGRLRSRGTPEALLTAAEGVAWETIVRAQDVPAARQWGVVTRTVRTPHGVRVRIVSPARPAPHAEPVQPDLEDAFLYAVHYGARAEVALP